MSSATKNFGLQQMEWADSDRSSFIMGFAISPWIDPYSNQRLWRERRAERRLEQCSSFSAWCQWPYKRLRAEIHKCIHKLPVQLSHVCQRPGPGLGINTGVLERMQIKGCYETSYTSRGIILMIAMHLWCNTYLHKWRCSQHLGLRRVWMLLYLVPTATQLQKCFLLEQNMSRLCRSVGK